MKTQNNTQKTVNEQVKGILLRGSAMIVGIALISLAVDAQDFWSQFSNNSGYGKTALMMNNRVSETKTTDAVFEAIDAETETQLNYSAATFALEAEQDNSLQLEAWMTDEARFTSHVDFNTIETEDELTVEDWMTNAYNFSNAMFDTSVEMEKPLEIEPWMAVEEYFNSVETLTSTEPALGVESWMLDSRIFNAQNEPMQLEAWMTDNQYWDNN